MKNSTNSTKKSPKRVLRLTLDQVEKAIEISNGNLHAACRLFKYADGTQVGWTSFYHYVRKYKLHLQLDKYREKVAYEAMEVVSMASKENWRAALAILDRYGKYIGLKREMSSCQMREELDAIERIEGYQEHKRESDPNFITRLDDEKLDISPQNESFCPSCAQHQQNEKESAAKGASRREAHGPKDLNGAGVIEICA